MQRRRGGVLPPAQAGTVPDKRQHRGPHPTDVRLFAAGTLPALRRAVADLSWLLSRGYADASARKLVGDRYQLAQRQRLAVMRAACSDAARQWRKQREIPPERLQGETLAVDGYNLLTTIEAALSGGVILNCRDGCFRDLASMHGTFRSVQETLPALELIGGCVQGWRAARLEWLLDSPVSNSGRLKQTILELARSRGWTWQVHLVAAVDAALRGSPVIVASADSAILDRCERWANLARWIIERCVPTAWIVDLQVGE